MKPPVQPHIVAQYDQLRAHASELLSQERAAEQPDRSATDEAFYKRGVLLALAGEKIPEDLLPFAIHRAQEQLIESHDHTQLNEELAALRLIKLTRKAGAIITKRGLTE